MQYYYKNKKQENKKNMKVNGLAGGTQECHHMEW